MVILLILATIFVRAVLVPVKHAPTKLTVCHATKATGTEPNARPSVTVAAMVTTQQKSATYATLTA